MLGGQFRVKSSIAVVALILGLVMGLPGAAGALSPIGSLLPPPQDARYIELCHGNLLGFCDTEDKWNLPGDDHTFIVFVTDALGRPVPGVFVQFRATGPGVFVPGGASTIVVTTDGNGMGTATMHSDVEGLSTVVAEISPESMPGTFRTAAVTDECEEEAGPGGEPPAGNCISITLKKLFSLTEPEPECDDGDDNDGDGFIDEDDPGCEDEFDDEDPVNPPKPTLVRQTRKISIRFNDGIRAPGNGLVVFGRLRAPDFPACHVDQPVKVQRRVNDRWVTQKESRTDQQGDYTAHLQRSVSGLYRVLAPARKIEGAEGSNEVNVCRKAVEEKRYSR